MSTETPRKEDVWTALVVFVALAILGPILDWSNADLLWGLILTSLVTCVLAAVLGAVSMGQIAWQNAPHETVERLKLLVVIPAMAFFGLILIAVIYGFHLFYAFFIYFLYPLWPEIENAFELSNEQQQRLLSEAAQRYWPMVVATLVCNWRSLLRPLHDPRPTDLFRPWALLVRMHLFIFAATAVLLVAGKGYLFYLLILLFFLFPWSLLVRHLSRRNAISGNKPSDSPQRHGGKFGKSPENGSTR